MRADHRWLVVFAGNFVFLFAVAQLNHHLTNLPLPGISNGQVYLFLLGLPLAFVALRLTLGLAVLTTVVTALAYEAGTPLPNGAILLPAAACVCVTHALRPHFNRFEPSSALIAALIINLVMIVALTLIIAYRGGGISLARVLVDLAISQLALALLTSWFFAAQMALLELFGFNLETELREPI
jgi:hypothetical protein